MYCIQCGVKLADTEKKCPLCETVVYHPQLTQGEAKELYPSRKLPKTTFSRAFLCGAYVILFLLPVIVTFFSDMQFDGELNWFGYVAGAIGMIYLIFALPLWFKAPNPVIFVPCDFAAAALYLWHINMATGGTWFFPFALPILAGVAVITCALVTLLRYLRRGKLYVVGGATMALGAWIWMVEVLISETFGLAFIGWSLYPAISLLLLGGLMIYLAMNSVAREKIERRIFF
jgi:hypothetical protein